MGQAVVGISLPIFRCGCTAGFVARLFCVESTTVDFRGLSLAALERAIAQWIAEHDR
jgi:hypothetical protein